MLKCIALLGAFLMTGCDTLDPKATTEPPPTIKTGLYETKQNVSIDGAFYIITLQINFQALTFQANGFVGELEIRQDKGTWSQSGDTIKTLNRLYRSINDAGGWGPWVSDADGAMKIRNVSATSFQKYFDGSGVDPSIQGLTPGWMTYNRIGD